MMQTRKSEAGFTLIELLVVITILGVLFGLVALNLTGVGSNAATNAKLAEKGMVQTAIDVTMTVSNTSTINAGGLTKVGPSTPDFGQYLRRESKYCYSWTTAGVVTQSACP